MTAGIEEASTSRHVEKDNVDTKDNVKDRFALPGRDNQVIQNRRSKSARIVGATDPSARSSMATVSVAVIALLFAVPAHAAGALVLIPEPPKLVALLVFFVLLIIPLNKMIFGPLFNMIDERDSKIAGATRDAEQLVAKAEELTNEYRGKIRGAREDAEVTRKQRLDAARSEQASITGDAKAETEGEIARARGEIEVSLNEARGTLEASSRDLAAIAAERILGRPLR